MSDIVERLKFIAVDNAETLTEDEHNTLSEGEAEIVHLRQALSEAETREQEARAKALEEAEAVCRKAADYWRNLSNDANCLNDARWNSRDEARFTMISYAERHETSAAAIRALQEKR